MTDADIIEKVGTRKLARALGVDSSVVSNWKKRGIPFPKRGVVMDALAEHITDREAFIRGEGRK